MNDVKCEQISEELSGAESTKWPPSYHAESTKLLDLDLKDYQFLNTLGFWVKDHFGSKGEKKNYNEVGRDQIIEYFSH